MLLMKLYELIRARLKSVDTGTQAKKEAIVRDCKYLCHDYIDDRLNRSGLNLKQRKKSEQRYSSQQKVSTADGFRRDSFPTLDGILKSLNTKRSEASVNEFTAKDLSRITLYIGECLEIRHSNVYTDVLQQLNIRSLPDINLRTVYKKVANEIFDKGVSWSKIISLFAFSGGLAVDCVLSGSSIHVTKVKNWTVEYIEDSLVDWILNQGGWVGLFDHYTTHCVDSAQISYEQHIPKNLFVFVFIPALTLLCIYGLIYSFIF